MAGPTFLSDVMDSLESMLADSGGPLIVSRQSKDSFRAAMGERSATGGTPFAAMASLVSAIEAPVADDGLADLI